MLNQTRRREQAKKPAAAALPQCSSQWSWLLFWSHRSSVSHLMILPASQAPLMMFSKIWKNLKSIFQGNYFPAIVAYLCNFALISNLSAIFLDLKNWIFCLILYKFSVENFKFCSQPKQSNVDVPKSRSEGLRQCESTAAPTGHPFDWRLQSHPMLGRKIHPSFSAKLVFSRCCWSVRQRLRWDHRPAEGKYRQKRSRLASWSAEPRRKSSGSSARCVWQGEPFGQGCCRGADSGQIAWRDWWQVERPCVHGQVTCVVNKNWKQDCYRLFGTKPTVWITFKCSRVLPMQLWNLNFLTCFTLKVVIASLSKISLQ